MDEKELRKLKRQDLLQLLLLQSREMNKVQEELRSLEQAHVTMQESRTRLIEKLDEKDEQIEHLKRRLDAKDDEIARLKATPIRLRDDAESSGEIALDDLLSAVKDTLYGKLTAEEPTDPPAAEDDTTVGAKNESPAPQ